MSAFVVSNVHINTLVTYCLLHRISYYSATERGRVTVTAENAGIIGRMLLDENVRSVSDRYPGSNGELPGTVGETPSHYHFEPTNWGKMSALAIVKLAHCLEYQSCEHDDYQASEAYKITAEIIRDATTRIPGYNDATWAIN